MNNRTEDTTASCEALHKSIVGAIGIAIADHVFPNDGYHALDIWEDLETGESFEGPWVERDTKEAARRIVDWLKERESEVVDMLSAHDSSKGDDR